jgi:hypothetical protein
MSSYEIYEEKIDDLAILLKQRIAMLQILSRERKSQQLPFAKIEDKIILLENIVEALEI